jgi:hypothetical protein
VNATCVPKNAGGGLKLRQRNLKKWIFSAWSVAGYLWPTAMNLQNGYRIFRGACGKQKGSVHPRLSVRRRTRAINIGIFLEKFCIRQPPIN